MAVVRKNSNLVHDFTDPASVAPDPQAKRGRLIISTGSVLVAATDSLGSMYRLTDLPSDCILHSDTFFDVGGDTFAQIVIGTETDTNALVDVAQSAANVISPIVKGDAFHGKYLWEVLGLATDPGGDITLWKHAEAAATGAGQMDFQICYITA